MDHWLEFGTVRLQCRADFDAALQYLDKVLRGEGAPLNFLVGGEAVTLADFAVWGALRGEAHLDGVSFWK